MMTQESALRKYTEDCKILREDLLLLIQDLEFQYLTEKGKIYYAVDFSEFHAYVVPENSDHGSNVFSLFSDRDNKSDQFIDEVLQRYALDRIFNREVEIILLTPYAIELGNFILKHRLKSIADFSNAMHSILFRTDDLQNSDEFKRFLSVAEKVNGSKKNELGDDDIENAKRFINNSNFFYYVIMSEIKDQNIHDLIERIFDSGRVKSLQDKGIFITVDSDDPVVARWREKAKSPSDREENTITSDAIATLMVERSNQFLKKQGRMEKVLLVTRSKRMNNIFSNELEHPENGWTANMLRHPRTFNVLCLVDSNEQDERAEKLKEKLGFIETLIEATQDREMPSRLSDHLGEQISTFKKEWKNIYELAATINLNKKSNKHSEDNELLKKAYEILTGASNFRSLLIEKLEQLSKRWEVSNKVLGFFPPLLNINNKSMLDDSLVIEKSKEVYLVKNTSESSYSIHVYSLKIRNIINEVATLNDNDELLDLISWENLFKSLCKVLLQSETKNNKDELFELYFVMSYLHGIIGEWKLAESYCESALKHLQSNDIYERNVDECYWFASICLRKWSPDIDDIQSRMNRCLKAINYSYKIKDNDIKFAKEQALQVLRLDLCFRSKMNTENFNRVLRDFCENDENVVINEKKLSPSRALNLIDESLKSISGNDILKVQIYNDKIFYNLKKKSYENKSLRKIMIEDYDAMTKIQKGLEKNEKRWKGFILDTIALFEWKVWGGDNADSISKIQSYFTWALNEKNAFHSRDEKALIKQHLNEYNNEYKLNNAHLNPKLNINM
jgi:hypothetical protein